MASQAETDEDYKKELEKAIEFFETSAKEASYYNPALAEALKEVQNLGNMDLSGMKDELNLYRKYCDHAAELMKYTDEKMRVRYQSQPLLPHTVADFQYVRLPVFPLPQDH